MMSLLQTDSVAVVQALKDCLTKMNLKNYEGEDVMKAVSHIRGVIKRLRGLERTDLTGNVIKTKVPSDLSKTLLEIFQTSSDDKFNKMFENLFLAGFQASITKGEAGVHPQTSRELLLRFVCLGLRMDGGSPEED